MNRSLDLGLIGTGVAAAAATVGVLLVAWPAPNAHAVKEPRFQQPSATPAPTPTVQRAAPITAHPRPVDPLLPNHPPEKARRAHRSTNTPELPWWRRPPRNEMKSELSAEQRGVNPCDSPDPGFGSYSHFEPLAHGLVAVPAEARGKDHFDLLIHFHGHELARKEVVKAGVPFVLYGLNLPGGEYRQTLGGPAGVTRIVRAVEDHLSTQDHPAHVAHVALGAWSGGYEAISVLLDQSDIDAVDAVILLDGLHGARDPAVLERQLEPFAAFARQAARGERFMAVVHSSVPTAHYASTTETAHWLVHQLGGHPVRVQRDDPLGLELVEMFDEGAFHARGYAGGGKLDHCAVLGAYPYVLGALKRRWHDSPQSDSLAPSSL